MNKTDIPVKTPVAWAQNAPGSNVTQPMPVAPQSSGHASYSDGFPPINSVEIAAGGIPPWGVDENGVHRDETTWLRWFQMGAPVPWDSTFSAALPTPGYPKGAIVASATTDNKFWLSTADGNVTNPDTGGAGWLSWPYPLYGADTGAVNAMVATLPLPLGATPIGSTIWIYPAFANTNSTPNISINGAGAVTITAPPSGGLANGAIAFHVPAELFVAAGPTYPSDPTSRSLWLMNPQVAGGAPAGAHGSQSYTTPGTHNFTIPATTLYMSCWGPGGGGGGGWGGGDLSGSGGGGGGFAYGVFTGLTVGNNIVVVIPSGGAGGAAGSGTDGSPGSGPTTITGYLQATTGGGGTGGAAGDLGQVPGAGGIPLSGFSFGVAGQWGRAPALIGGSFPEGGDGGSTAGGGLGGRGTSRVAGSYPSTFFAGSTPGGGGAGGCGPTSQPGGDGAPGGVLITW